jgi:hypothetical protein
MTAAKASFVHPLCGPDRWNLSGVRRLQPGTDCPSRKELPKIDGEVRLTDEQAALCRTLLCQELMKASNLLASGKDCNGRKLIDQTKQSLMVFSSRLQLTLLALGMTSRELADIVKSF